MRSEHPENASAADHVAAAAVNILRAAENSQPAGTCTPTETVVRHVVFSTGEACPCSCAGWCQVCVKPPSDAA